MPDSLEELINEIKKKKMAANATQEEPQAESKKKPKLPLESRLEKKIPQSAARMQATKELEKIKQELKQKISGPDASTAKEEEPKTRINSTKQQEENERQTGYSMEKQESAETAPEDTEELSEEQKKIQKAGKTLIDSYGNVKIFKVEGSKLLHYVVPVERPTTTEKTIINTIKEAATRLITISPYKIRDPEQKRNIYYQKVMEILESSPQLNIQKRRFTFYAEAVVREMVGYGIIDQLVADDDLEEIMVIGPRTPVYIFHRKYEMMTTNIEFYSDQEIVDLINRIARQVGRRVDISSPLLDARLPDGSRVNATIPPASVMGSSLTIRKFKKDPLTIIDLLRENTLDCELAAFLWVCVEGLGVKPANILISGGTGSGKTTLLNALGTFIQPQERIISIEDTAELNLPIKHWIRFEGRPPGLEGTGELTIDIMTKNSLRMRPDRVMVGEIRHAEAFSLFTAMNTGHDGCMGTVHANTAKETVIRVTSPPMNVPEVMLSGLDIIIVEQRLHDKQKGTIRRITDISEVSGVLEHKTTTKMIYEYDHVTDKINRTKTEISFIKTLQKFTGWTNERMAQEIEKRKKFLKKINDQNIHKMQEVHDACQDFILKEEEEVKDATARRIAQKN